MAMLLKQVQLLNTFLVQDAEAKIWEKWIIPSGMDG